jgi:fatty-acyl-CoA synthase
MLSHVIGSTDVPLLDITIGMALDLAADRWTDKIALIDRGQDVRLTWRELRERSDHLAAGFLALGLKTGDRIGIWSLNRVEWALTQFAAAKAGLILVTINPAYRTTELEFALAEAGCVALVLAPAFKTSDYLWMIQSLAPEMALAGADGICSARLPSLRWVLQMGPDPIAGSIAFAKIEAMGERTALSHLFALSQTLNAYDAINIQFTSGTTGAPKGVGLRRT